MSKWIIVSDNHNETGILYQVYDQHQDADVFLHLGDSEFQYDDTELSLYHRVKGNCDFYPEFPEEQSITHHDVRAFYTHGHLYQVNQTRMKLAEKAKTIGAQLAFYGDTHVAKYENLANVHVINPGSISQSRSTVEETYAELIIDDTTLQCTLNFRNRENKAIDTIEFKLENS